MVLDEDDCKMWELVSDLLKVHNARALALPLPRPRPSSLRRVRNDLCHPGPTAEDLRKLFKTVGDQVFLGRKLKRTIIVERIIDLMKDLKVEISGRKDVSVYISS